MPRSKSPQPDETTLRGVPGYRDGVNNTNMIWWMVVGWLPAVLLWSFGDDLFSKMGGVAWIGFMFWVFWRRENQR